MTDDPAIFYTTAIGMAVAAFAILRTLATERQHRIHLLTSALEAQRALQQQDQKADEPK